jgi:predicted transcriptional regulator
MIIMSTEEIKNQLYEGIENIDDNEFLMTIKELIDQKYSTSSIPKLSDWQIQMIKESEKQIENGEFLTNDEVEKLIDKWLNE